MRSMTFVALLAGILAVCSVGVCAGGALVANGDFMRVNEDGTPADWDMIEVSALKDTYGIYVSRETIHDNKYSLVMRLNGTDSYFENRRGAVGVRSGRFPVTPGEQYIFSYNIRTEGLKEVGRRDEKGIAPGSRHAAAIIYFFDAQGSRLTSRTTHYFSDVEEFRNDRQEIEVPEGARQALVQAMLANISRDETATVMLNGVRAERAMPETGDSAYPMPTRKSYLAGLQTINQYREEAYMQNYALVALRASAWSNSIYNEGTPHAYDAHYAIDGISETSVVEGRRVVSQWVGKPLPQQEGPYRLKITLPEEKTVHATFWMRFTAEGVHRNRSPQDYRIMVSTDDSSWTTVSEVRNYQYNSRYDNFSPVRARYVMMEIDTVQLESMNGPAIIEFKVLGLKDGAEETYSGWWDSGWHYRMSLDIPQEDGAVTIPVAFTRTAGIIRERFLEDSIRVIAGGKQEVSFLFLPDADYDPESNASGTILFTAERGVKYHCYFDTCAGGVKTGAEYSIDGVSVTPHFTRDGWAAEITLDPQTVMQAVIFDSGNNPVKTLHAGPAQPSMPTSFSFGESYYARIHRVKEDAVFGIEETVDHLWLREPAGETIAVNIQLPRRAFVRNENISVKTILTNTRGEQLKGTLSVAVLDAAGTRWYGKDLPFGVEGHSISELDAVFTEVNLREDGYVISVSVRDGSGTFLAPPRETGIAMMEDKDIKFLYGMFGTGYTRGQEGYERALKTMSEAGLNAVTGNDAAALNVYLEHGLKAIGKIAWPFMHHRKDLAGMSYMNEPVYPLYVKDPGSVWYPNYTHPEVRDYAKQWFRDYLETIADHPAFSGYVFTNDDYQLPSRHGPSFNFAGYSETDKTLFSQLTGFEPPVPQDVELKTGIIPDDDLWSRFIRFRVEELFAKGNHQVLVDAKNETSPWVRVGNVHGPMQDNFFLPSQGLYPPVQQSVFDFVGGYSYLNQWREWKRYATYGDLCRMGRINREHGRELILLPPLAHCVGFRHVGGGLYRRDGMMPADWQFRNQVYLALAGGFNGLWFYGWRDGTRDAGDKPELIAEVGRIGRLLRDYGPFLKSLHTPDKPVGVLVSITDSAYGSESLPSAPGHNRNNPFFILDEFLREQIPAEAFSEGEALEGILDKYDAVVLHNLTVMKESVAGRIRQYMHNGGTVLLSGRNDYISFENAERVPVEGLADRLREIITPPAEAESRELAIRELSDGAATYIFFVDCFFDKYAFNVRSRFPEYWEQWSDEEMTIKVEPVTERITVNRRFVHAVDVFGRREIPLAETGNGCAFTLEMEPGGGMLVAFYPQPVARLELDVPEEITAGNLFAASLTIYGANGELFKGALPVRIDIFDSAGNPCRLSDSYAAVDGRLQTVKQTAVNDRKGKTRIVVTELATGLSAERTILFK